jgi:DNA repair/transcription protein MET18/MMS19
MFEYLQHVFCSTQYFEPFVIPLLLDKLSSSLPLAKVSSSTFCIAPTEQFTIVNALSNLVVLIFYFQIDSLKYLDKCIRFYGADRMVRHASVVWYKLKEVIFNLSSDQLLISEALNCLKTAIMYTDSSDKDLFINLMLRVAKSLEVAVVTNISESEVCSPCWLLVLCNFSFFISN